MRRIRYLNPFDFRHISRYRGLRQIVDIDNNHISLESTNPWQSRLPVRWHTVTQKQENRLDIIAKDIYGSEMYSWVVVRMNNISDGFTVNAGTKIAVIDNFFDLINKGEILAAIPPFTLNLRQE
jgi:hypothetical protein